MQALPGLLEKALPAWQSAIDALAPQLDGASALLYLGRGVHYAIAREGALKLKESAYLSAEGYPAGELKHGPSALVSNTTPLVIVATADAEDPDSLLRYEKILALVKTLREQGARMTVLATEGDKEIESFCDSCIYVPATSDLLAPMLEVVPLQLLAYTLAVRRGIDVDRPRNLVKAVVSE